MKQNRIRYVAWILLVVLIMQAAPFGVHAIEADKMALTSDELTPEYLIGTWVGSYTGSEDRNIILEIDYCNDDGVFQGCATIDDGAVKYMFSGNVNFQSGAISFIGKEWLVNDAGFTKFVEFSGEIDGAYGKIEGIVGGNTNQTFALEKITEIDLSKLPGDWQGQYDGKDNNVVVKRNIELHFTSVDEKGEVRGSATVSPSEAADELYAANGSYNFDGTIDFRTGKIDIQGYEWTDYPAGYRDFSFVDLSGFINLNHGTITGSTPSGDWTMSVITYDDIVPKSEFTIGEDNQSFTHEIIQHEGSEHPNKRYGFYGVDNYAIDPQYAEYEDRLYQLASEGEANKVQRTLNRKWGGDCYGLAVTMGLLYDGRIGMSDLTESGKETYFKLDAPSNDKKLLSIFHALYVTQVIKAGDNQRIAVSQTHRRTNVLTWINGSGDSLSVFLAKLVQESRKGKVFLLQYAVAAGWSHSVLVTDCDFDTDAGEYVLQIYDANRSKENLNGEVSHDFSEFRISKDYSEFCYKHELKYIDLETGEITPADSIVIANKEDAEERWISLYFLNLDSINNVTNTIFNLDSQQASTADVVLSAQDAEDVRSVLWFPIASEPFTIENESGEYLTYDGGVFDGTMVLHGISTAGSGTQSQFGIKVDYSQSFTVRNIESSIDFEVVNEKTFMALSGTNVASATLDEANGIDIDGNQYSFEAVLSTDDIAEGRNGLVSISASVDSGKVSIASDGVQAAVKSEEPLEDVTTKTYIGTEVYERNLDDGMTDLVVDATDTTTTVPSFTDVPEGAWYYDPVMWALEEDITSGTSDTTFSPADPCNRAQAVTFLWAAAGKPEPTLTEHSFVDVPKGSFCEKAVLWAVEKGITTGTDETHFSPLTVCNRATIVTFLYKAFNSPEVNAAENPFEDVPAESWYTVPALWAKEQGITSGTDATHFSPASICNRAQIVTFLYGAYSK